MPWDTVADQPGSVAKTVRRELEVLYFAEKRATSSSSRSRFSEIKKKSKHQDVIKDPRDPACYDCARLGKKGSNNNSGSGGAPRARVDPEDAAEDLAVEGGEGEGATEAAEVVVVVDEGSDGAPDLLFVAPSVPSPAPAPSLSPSAVARPSRRREAASAEEEDDKVGPLPSP